MEVRSQKPGAGSEVEKEQSKRERETIAIGMWNMKVLITGVNGQVGWDTT